jgi:hypothetical protein
VHVCFDSVFDVQQRCRAALVSGCSCDTNAVADAIDAEIRTMRMALTSGCAVGQLTEIGYIGFTDAEGDLFNACVTQARDAVPYDDLETHSH